MISLELQVSSFIQKKYALLATDTKDITLPFRLQMQEANAIALEST
jgi:hypothetical protein